MHRQHRPHSPPSLPVPSSTSLAMIVTAAANEREAVAAVMAYVRATNWLSQPFHEANAILFAACELGYNDVATYLLVFQDVIDVNWRNPDKDGNTALHAAAAGGHAAVVRTLVQRFRGIAHWLLNNCGEQAVDCARECSFAPGCRECMCFLENPNDAASSSSAPGHSSVASEVSTSLRGEASPRGGCPEWQKFVHGSWRSIGFPDNATIEDVFEGANPPPYCVIQGRCTVSFRDMTYTSCSGRTYKIRRIAPARTVGSRRRDSALMACSVEGCRDVVVRHGRCHTHQAAPDSHTTVVLDTFVPWPPSTSSAASCTTHTHASGFSKQWTDFVAEDTHSLAPSVHSSDSGSECDHYCGFFLAPHELGC